MRHAISTLLVALAVGAIGYGIGHWHPSQATSPAEQHAASKQLYVCPMHPQIVQDHPGSCPICGMDLVKAAGTEHEDASMVHVDTATQQKLGVTLATAHMQEIANPIHTYGTVTADDSYSFVITPTVPGQLTKLAATHVGQHLTAGQVLYEIQSDILLQLQHDYVDFLIRQRQTLANADAVRARNRNQMENMKNPDEAGRALMERNMRQSEEQIQSMLQPMQRDGIRLTTRLKYAGVTDAILKHMNKSGVGVPLIPVKLAHDCLVEKIGARSGSTVAADTPIVTCAGTGRLWLEVALYPDQASLAQTGDEFTARGERNISIEGRLGQASGILDPANRTTRLRIPLESKKLRLGDYFDVTIQASPHQGLTIPRSALIRTGHGDYVILARGNGHFLPTQVEAGIESDDEVEITDGLQEGAQVVVNGNFLLDSASSMAATVARMSGAAKQ